MHAHTTLSLSTRHVDGTIDTCARRPQKWSGAHIQWISMGWLDKSWPVGIDDGARRSAMVCVVSVRVATENGRKIDLSQRVS